MDTTSGGPATIGLIGTITRDRIIHEAGPTFAGVGVGVRATWAVAAAQGRDRSHGPHIPISLREER